MVITVLQTILGEDGSRRDNGGGGWRHGKEKDLARGVVEVVMRWEEKRRMEERRPKGTVNKENRNPEP